MTFNLADPGSVAIDYLLRCGIESAILIPLILLLQRLSGDRLSPTAKHALWIILLIRLSIPAFPESRLSLFNLADNIHWEKLSKNQTVIAHTPERLLPFQISQEPILSPRQDQYVTARRLNKSKIHFKQRSKELEARTRPNSYTFPLDVDPDGNFTVTSVPPGEYKLEATVIETLAVCRT
jgi:hypothetical protein